MLQQVQQVQLAPVDQAPRVVTDIDPLGNVPGTATNLRSAPAVAAATEVPVTDRIAADILPADRLSRPEALDLPVLVSRDGPIAAIKPNRGQAVSAAVAETPATPAVPGTEVQVVAAARPGVELFAVRPSWVRVKAADGTVLFEKILDAGERYVVPQMETPPLLRAGNSGSVYFAVNGQTYGPAAPGAQVVNNVDLSPEGLIAAYALADLTQDPDLTRYASNTEAEPVLPVMEVPQN